MFNPPARVTLLALLLASCTTPPKQQVLIEQQTSCEHDTDCGSSGVCLTSRCLSVQDATCSADADCVLPAGLCRDTAGACVRGACVFAVAAAGTACTDNNVCTHDDT